MIVLPPLTTRRPRLVNHGFAVVVDVAWKARQGKGQDCIPHDNKNTRKLVHLIVVVIFFSSSIYYDINDYIFYIILLRVLLLLLFLFFFTVNPLLTL
jgi:hypothetical protein